MGRATRTAVMPPADTPDFRDGEIARLRATVTELVAVVADLRRQVESQQVRIDQLLKLAFGPRGGVGPGLLAQVVVAKFVDHLPLNRQTMILAREGWAVPRSTLCDHLAACGRLLRPLSDLMASRVQASYALHADKTPVTLLRPRRSAYAWVYVGDAANPYTVFDLTPGRRKEFPEAFLAGYLGFVQADASAGSNGVHAGTRHVGCWMHARRGFVEARRSDPTRAAEALGFVRELYAVARGIAAAGLVGESVAGYRRARASPSSTGSPGGWRSSRGGRCRSPRSGRRWATRGTAGRA